jgi:hypothetical protein
VRHLTAEKTLERFCLGLSVGRLHDLDVYDARSIHFAHDPFVRTNDTEIKFATVSDEGHFLTDDYQNGHITQFSSFSPFVYLAFEWLFAPSIRKSGIASNLQAVLRGRDDNLGSVGFPGWPQPLIIQSVVRSKSCTRFERRSSCTKTPLVSPVRRSSLPCNKACNLHMLCSRRAQAFACLFLLFEIMSKLAHLGFRYQRRLMARSVGSCGAAACPELRKDRM